MSDIPRDGRYVVVRAEAAAKYKRDGELVDVLTDEVGNRYWCWAGESSLYTNWPFSACVRVKEATP